MEIDKHAKFNFLKKIGGIKEIKQKLRTICRNLKDPSVTCPLSISINKIDEVIKVVLSKLAKKIFKGYHQLE